MTEWEVYEKHCKGEFESIRQYQSERRKEQAHQYANILREIKGINEVLNGNGKEGFKVRLDRVERTIKGFLWVASIVLSAVVVTVVKAWFS